MLKLPASLKILDKLSIIKYSKDTMKKKQREKESKQRSKKRKEQMQRLRAQGLSYSQIGKLWNRSRQRVHQILSGYEKCLQNDGERQWYGTMRLIVFERDKHRCVKCNSAEDLLVHHIDGNDTHNCEGNLATLCFSCHTSLHAEMRRNNNSVSASKLKKIIA